MSNTTLLDQIVNDRHYFRMKHSICPTTLYLGNFQIIEIVELINANAPNVDTKIPSQNEIERWKVTGMRIVHVKRPNYFKVTI